jgi:hypothetical protein
MISKSGLPAMDLRSMSFLHSALRFYGEKPVELLPTENIKKGNHGFLFLLIGLRLQPFKF